MEKHIHIKILDYETNPHVIIDSFIVNGQKYQVGLPLDAYLKSLDKQNIEYSIEKIMHN